MLLKVVFHCVVPSFLAKVHEMALLTALNDVTVEPLRLQLALFDKVVFLSGEHQLFTLWLWLLDWLTVKTDLEVRVVVDR